MLPLTLSSSATSASLSRQPTAPATSASCRSFFTPGMGSVPLQMHQLSATCAGDLPPWAAPTSRMTCVTREDVVALSWWLSAGAPAAGAEGDAGCCTSGLLLLLLLLLNRCATNASMQGSDPGSFRSECSAVPATGWQVHGDAQWQVHGDAQWRALAPTCSSGWISLMREPLKMAARGPLGLGPSAVYLPVSRPWHRGLYATCRGGGQQAVEYSSGHQPLEHQDKGTIKPSTQQ
jgi:hypothetical protein